MSKKRRFKDKWKSQTAIGEQFGISAIEVGEELKKMGLRTPNGKPTKIAIEHQFCTPTPLRDGTPFFLWNEPRISSLLIQAGYKQPDGARTTQVVRVHKYH